MPAQSVIIIGAGIYGVTASIELRQRGYDVSLFDPGPLPHPLAASTDISKAIRMDYGADEGYMALMESALDIWRQWNAIFPEPLFHETGVTYLCQSEMKPGGFEHDSYQLLLKRGHKPQRMRSDDIRKSFPVWNADLYVDGYFNPEGGYAESGKVVTRLIEEATRLGVKLFPNQKFARLIEKGSRVGGIINGDGVTFESDAVIICAGAWTHHLLPHLKGMLRSVGQPVFHLRPNDPLPYWPSRFPTYGADISNSGYYGFPINRDGVVKIANHGVGREMHPESSDRVVTPKEMRQLREFLQASFPSLAAAPITYTRVCLYSDTFDGHLWIDRDPDREGLVAAAGDSGHAFKFAPVLGSIIADALEGKTNPRFRWRPEVKPPKSEEAARHQ